MTGDIVKHVIEAGIKAIESSTNTVFAGHDTITDKVDTAYYFIEDSLPFIVDIFSVGQQVVVIASPPMSDENGIVTFPSTDTFKQNAMDTLKQNPTERKTVDDLPQSNSPGFSTIMLLNRRNR